METKFPVESDFGKYFNYVLYLRSLKNQNKETKNELDNAITFQKCINLNRSSLRLLNCGERKKKLDNFIEQNFESFSEFKEKISPDCAPQISKYLSLKFHLESSNLDSTLFEKINIMSMVDKNLIDVEECLNL